MDAPSTQSLSRADSGDLVCKPSTTPDVFPCTKRSNRPTSPSGLPHWSHPRSRGEHAFQKFRNPSTLGSSPLARGAPARGSVGEGARGIIPARAGSTRWCGTLSSCSWDHPRSRGEHLRPARHRYLMAGSSPLARGAPASSLASSTTPRIIPARAGSTNTATEDHAGTGDHPRSRGEHSVPTGVTRMCWGSSPLARGAPIMVFDCSGRVGIIPARAGSTPFRALGGRGPGDHPRSRGEHAITARVVNPVVGSSPLARGARAVCCAVSVPEGIIPARAGSTRTSTGLHPAARDHPRSRGEHAYLRNVGQQMGGSSPLARGALHFRGHVRR